MALQSSGLPSIAGAATELWPSIAGSFTAPWASSSVAVRTARTIRKTLETKPRLPSCLREATLTHPLLAKATAPITTTPIQNMFAAMSRQSIAAANALMPLSGSTLLSRPGSRSISTIGSARSFSTTRSPTGPLQLMPNFLSTLRQSPLSRPRVAFRFQPVSAASGLSWASQRSFGSGISRNLLANREEAANRNPGSATAQNAFYQVLLKANMPAIVVERHQSGRFASNEATREAYHRALGMISASTVGVGVGIPVGVNPTGGVQAGAVAQPLATQATGAHTPAQLQAIGQAVAAHTRGGSIATADESKGGPIHVVINESLSGTVFRWFRFILWFALFSYVSMLVLSILLDYMTSWKKPGGRQGTETKAEKQSTRFSDVHGCDEAKEELQELVEFLKNPERFSTLGGKLPKGVLLVGPPGTGKTLLARAVAGEAGVPFHYMSGSEFDEVYVGVGARRVRDLFASAKAHSPSIVFIDELDAIGGKRNTRDAAYVKQTLNQLLTELDGFNQDSGVIIIGATNFPELLDKALTRPGRFDRHVVVDLPDVRGRIAILKHHAKKIKASPDVDIDAIAMSTSGLSGAELESIVNQAAIHASKTKASVVSTKDFDWAKDKVIMGAERRSMVISAKEKEMTAYHEAGHALINYYAKSAPRKLFKVTILPRGMTLGHTAFLPEMDKYSYTMKDYLHDIEASLGGKIAEELVYGREMVTSGVASDLDQATSMAYSMVSRFGMSQKLGPMEYHRQYQNLSGSTKALIEAEVQKTLIDAQDRGRQLLMSKRKELDLLARALVEYETLDVKEVEAVLRGEELKGRTKIPVGPMVVPALAQPLAEVTPFPGPGGGSDADGEGDRATPPPPPPPPPAAAPRTEDGVGR